MHINEKRLNCEDILFFFFFFLFCESILIQFKHFDCKTNDCSRKIAASTPSKATEWITSEYKRIYLLKHFFMVICIANGYYCWLLSLLFSYLYTFGLASVAFFPCSFRRLDDDRTVRCTATAIDGLAAAQLP